VTVGRGANIVPITAAAAVPVTTRTVVTAHDRKPCRPPLLEPLAPAKTPAARPPTKAAMIPEADYHAKAPQPMA
jgi:hypothetical protein